MPSYLTDKQKEIIRSVIAGSDTPLTAKQISSQLRLMSIELKPKEFTAICIQIPIYSNEMNNSNGL